MRIPLLWQPHRSHRKIFFKTCDFQHTRAAVKSHGKRVWKCGIGYHNDVAPRVWGIRLSGQTLLNELRFCVLSRKHLDKTARLCYHILRKWHAFICSNKIFRGIAQLVEQRSPNVNTATNIRINTELSRLGTSVSSLFSCFLFCKL